MAHDSHYASLDVLRTQGVNFAKDFHELRSSDVEKILQAAKIAKYRKSKTAPGSTARMYYEYLQRLAGR